MKAMKSKHLTAIAITLLLSAIISITAAQDQKKSFTVKSGDMLEVSTRMGNITIDTWDKNEVNVVVKNVIDSEIALLTMVQNGNKVEVIFEGEDSYHIEFDISIPSKFDLELSTGGGNITLKNDLDGKIDASTAGGNISMKNIKGEADISTAGGNIKVGDINSKADISTAGGNIKVGDINSDADISTAGGDMKIGNINGMADISTAGGNIKIGYIKGGADVSSAGGNISVDNIGGNADISTGGGNVKVGSVSGSAELNTGGGNISLEAATGKVEVNTGAGNINLENIKGGIEANTGAGNIYAKLIPDGESVSELNTGVGNITLYVPASAKVTIVATAHVQMWDDESELQNIKSEFAPTTVNRYRNKKQIEVTFELNGGGSKIELNVALGEIEIKKLR
ncbi:MAG: hypothetical protein IH852_09770 [Bacteroidetes bacterium]|nr:hypothetical protein [Bacteroidota bacterium]